MNRLRFIFLAFLCFWIAIAIPSARDSVKAMPPNSTLNFSLSLQKPHQNSINPNLPNSFKSLIDGENTAPLLQQAKAAYENEDYHNAVMLLEQAVEIFAREGEDFKRAISLSNLSLAYQKLGEWKKAEDDINLSIKLLKMQEQSPQNSLILAQSFNIQGRLWYEKGQTEQALQNWQEAEQVYRELSNSEGIIASKINQIQALQTLGLFQRSRDLFGEIESAIAQLPDSRVKIKALRSFGDLLRNLGELNTSQERANCQLATENRSCDSEDILQKSLEVANRAKQSASPSEIRAIDSEIGAVLLSLGNTIRAKGNLLRDRASTSINFDYLPWRYQTIDVIPQTAQQFYQDAAAKYRDALATSSLSTLTKIQAQLNLLGLLIELGKRAEIESLAREIDIAKLPPSRSSVYAQVNLAKNLAFWQQKERAPAIGEIKQLLERALQEAKELEDKRAESYVVGNLGGFYEYRAWQEQPHQSTQNINSEDWQQAEKFTRQALNLIQPLESPDLAYQWEWQLGRLLVQKKELQRATFNYEAAAKSLDLIRGDLLSINTDVQFSFRDNVEPLYRQLLDLLLATANSENLKKSITYVESLQLAELENFLQCDLKTRFLGKQEQLANATEAISAKLEELLAKDSTIALVYPIVLSNRLHVIWKFPGEDLKHYSYPIPALEIENILQNVRRGILKNDPTQFKKNTQMLYEWLVEPVEEELKNNARIKIMGFVLDGSFRQIPLSTLYDAKTEKYLVEKDYALVILPSLQLIDLENSAVQFKVLGAGISAAMTVGERQFSQINVNEELKVVADEILLNSNFTFKELQNKIESGKFSVVHLATHGKFSSDPEETYILIYDPDTASGRLLKAKEFDTLLRNRDRNSRLELLVLSACETAEGDKRATLGLAGLSVRSGVGSTLATLWQVSDDSTVELMKVFYNALRQPGVTKAEALHRAQQSLFYHQRYQVPYYWSPYILVGNWS